MRTSGRQAAPRGAQRDESTSRAKQRKRERVIYNTRLDLFLSRRNVNLDLLAVKADMTRNNLGRLRAGQKPRLDTVVRLVLALRDILCEPVFASELYYLGEPQDDGSPEAGEYTRLGSTAWAEENR